MADSPEEGKGDNNSSSVVTNANNETSNASSVMDIDSPAGVDTSSKNGSAIDSNRKEENVENVADDGFLVVEEDDGGDCTSEKGKADGESTTQTFKTPEPEPMDEANSGGDEVPTKIKTEKKEVLLVNPLFGKRIAPPPPVINIESSSSSSEDDSEEEDFSLDVSVNNFVQPGGEGEDNIATIEDGGVVNDGPENGAPALQRRANGQSCNCDCYHEKGILVNEIERLRRAVFELSERHSVLEDFIEVEYSESFDKFLKNREHLVSMGFGGKDSEGSEDIIDGKRGAKSAELIELLKMIKEQANAKIKEESETKKPASSSTSSSQSQKSHQPKPKSIPSVSSQRERDRGSGRGGALSYNQRPVMVPNVAAAQHPYANAMNYQYQQQMLAAQQGAQARHYHESMYGVRDSRDIISAVGRTDLYPSSSSTNYGYGGYGVGNRSDNKETKKHRKRKRQSEVSSEASSAGAAAGSSKNIPNGGKSQPPQQQKSEPTKKNSSAADIDDVEIIDYNTSQELNVNTKRICPLCEKIINRKQLRDHLSIVHQGHKVACPVCQAEFMQRRRIKTHMRDSHDLPVSEYSAYIDKIYSNIEEQCGPWLDKLMKEAETPTKDQLLVHNAEIQMQILARREQKAAAALAAEEDGTSSSATVAPMKPPAPRTSEPASSSRTSGGHTSSASGGSSRRSGERRDVRDRDRGSSSRGGSSSYPSSHPQQSVRYFTGANTKVAPSSSKSHGSGGRGPSSEDLYGPGGYAQYAQRYLQQRAATGSATTGVNRLYNPF